MLAALGPNSSKGDLPGYVRRSFKGSIRIIELRRGFRLFTLSQRKVLRNPKGRGHGEVTQWWSPYKHFKGDPGYKGRVDLAESVRMDLLAALKDCGAYANEKGGLRYVVIATLTEPVWAAFGQIRREGKVGGLNTGEPKRFFQLYIPGLVENQTVKRIGGIDLVQKNSQENQAVAQAADSGPGGVAA